MGAFAHSMSSVRLRRALRATYRLIANSAAAPLLQAPVVERGRRRLTATYVALEDVVEILGVLNARGVHAWLVGGWACDALLGEQSRPHSDIDLVIPDLAAPRAVEVLRRRGFAIYERRPAGLLSSALELIDRRRRRVALHLVDLDQGGRGDWERAIRTAGKAIGQDCRELFATGYLGGRALPCVSAAAQLVLHTGYPPGVEDRHNVRLLCERFSLRLPPGYPASGTTALLIPVPEAELVF